MSANESQGPLDDLQPGNIDVEPHPVDPFHFQGNLLLENFSHALWYGHHRLRLWVGLYGPPTASAVS